MIVSDSQREENFQEYLRLNNNPDYYDVTFDDKSGGVSAIHKEHCFDKQVGPFGRRRGQYEVEVLNILRENGRVVTLESEFPKGKYIKAFDAYVNLASTEIKTVESNGRWSVRTKIYLAVKQGAEMLVLYYPNMSFFSMEKIIEGWNLNRLSKTAEPLKRILAVVNGKVLEISKPLE